MLWRVRTTLADRPGALAQLAEHCGFGGVNILGMQIFPGIDSVTDELVIRAPEEWGIDGVAEMVAAAGGADISISPCTPHALVDGPTRYLLAVQHVVDDPASLLGAIAELLDCDGGLVSGLGDQWSGIERGRDTTPRPSVPRPSVPKPGAGVPDPSWGQSVLELPAGSGTVTLYRAAPFTATEVGRAQAFVRLVDDLLSREQARTVELVVGEPVYRLATVGDALALVRMAERCSSQTLAARFGVPLAGLQPKAARSLLTEGPALVVQVGHEVVGLATLTTAEPAGATVLVEDGWQGRGVGTRLLSLAARLAKARGAQELLLTSEHANDAVLRLSVAAGLTGRVRHDNGRVVQMVSLRRIAPLLQNAEGVTARSAGQREEIVLTGGR